MYKRNVPLIIIISILILMLALVYYEIGRASCRERV